VKVTLKERAVMFALPLIVTVAVYVPAASPVFGMTVKPALPPCDMLAIVVADSVKRLAPAPPQPASSQAPSRAKALVQVPS